MLIAHPVKAQMRPEDHLASDLQASLKDHIACRHANGLTSQSLYLWSEFKLMCTR